MRSWNSYALAALVLGATAATAGAQAKPAAAAQASQCSIDENKPNQVKDARNNLVKGGLISAPAEKLKLLQSTVKLVTEGADKMENSVGRNWVLGRALVTIAAMPSQAAVTTRGSVGYATDPQGQIDLLAAADSAFRVVESAKPECVSETEPYRRQLYAPIVTKAVNFYNAQQRDSAEWYAKRALVIYPSSPIAYNVLGNLAQAKEDYAGATDMFRRMISAIGRDTAYAEDRKAAMMGLGSLLEARADRATGAEKEALLKEARSAYEAYLRDYPGDPKAQAGLARVQGMAGDTAAVTAHYNTMLSDPSKFTDIQLFEGGVGAARANNAKLATQLFAAGLKKNPWYRDALFNLAATYSGTEEYDKMIPVVARLLQVDPNNPENYQLMALAYQGLIKRTRDSASKAAPAGGRAGAGGRGGAGRGGAAASQADNPALRAMNDSLLKYFKLFQDMPVKVSFNLFSHDGTKTTLGGSIENRSDKEATYDMKVEFVDVNGNVLATQSTTVAAVPPKGSKPFTITADKEGIVAFRYASVIK